MVSEIGRLRNGIVGINSFDLFSLVALFLLLRILINLFELLLHRLLDLLACGLVGLRLLLLDYPQPLLLDLPVQDEVGFLFDHRQKLPLSVTGRYIKGCLYDIVAELVLYQIF